MPSTHIVDGLDARPVRYCRAHAEKAPWRNPRSTAIVFRCGRFVHQHGFSALVVCRAVLTTAKGAAEESEDAL
jgi:hypothetical protein